MATTRIDRQADVLAQGQEHADDERDRRGDGHRRRHHDEHLHLLHVVGDARDQRRRAERADLAGRVAGHLVEQRGRAGRGRSPSRRGAEVHGGDLEGALHERPAEHQEAVRLRCSSLSPRSTPLSMMSALRPGSVRRGRGLHGLQDDDQHDQAAVRPQVRSQQRAQHGRASLPTPCRNSAAMRSAGSSSLASIGWLVDIVSAASQRAAAAGSTVIWSRWAANRRRGRGGRGSAHACGSAARRRPSAGP